jgi:serine/threonine protein kinase
MPMPVRSFAARIVHAALVVALVPWLGAWKVGSVIVTKDGARWRIESVLGEGGFGKVVKAVSVRSDGKDGERAAFKFFTRQSDAHDTIDYYEDLFRTFNPNDNEFVLHLDIPGEVEVETDGVSKSFVVMKTELAAADLWSAKELLPKSPATLSRSELSRRLQAITSILEMGSRGVASVMAAGLVHGDLKEGNFLITGNLDQLLTGKARVIVSDLDALARIGGVQPHTSSYAGPEYFNRSVGPITGAFDVYSFSATLYSLLIGAAPVTHLYVTKNSGTLDWDEVVAMSERLAESQATYAELEAFVASRLDAYIKSASPNRADADKLERLKAFILAGLKYRPEDRIAALRKVEPGSPLIPAYDKMMREFPGPCPLLDARITPVPH